MENQENSGVNTILIVIVLLIIVGALVWFFAGRSPTPTQTPQETPKELKIDVNLPNNEAPATE